jgi:hypothetical protein
MGSNVCVFHDRDRLEQKGDGDEEEMTSHRQGLMLVVVSPGSQGKSTVPSLRDNS